MIPFGKTGTVIGGYKADIEILFDEPFIGATNLSGRCPPFMGAVVSFFDIFVLDEWHKDIQMFSKYYGTKYEVPEWDG
jgi:Xrn1 SH3-like domain